MSDTDYIGAIVSSEEEDVEHSGKKGMKWGVRNDKDHIGEKAKTKTIAKLDKKYDKESFVAVNNAVAKRINPKLNELNSRPEFDRDMDEGTPLHDKYIGEYRKALQTSLDQAAKDIGTNASGTKGVRLTIVGEGLDTYYEAHSVDIKHSDLEPDFVIIPEFSSNGQIVGQTIQSKADLEHSGVKGMHWGVRKPKDPAKVAAKAEAKEARSAIRIGERPKGHTGPEAPADRYNRLLTKAKTQGANSFTDDELNFVTRRGNAINQVNKLNAQNPGWIEVLSKNYLDNANRK